MNDKPWTKYFQNRETSTTRFFCIPHAGGTAEYFISWRKKLPSWVDLCPIQLPGRSYRLSEPTPESIQDLSLDLVEVIHEHSDRPFILFGHSMGSLLAYETANLLQKKPEVLVLSGGEPPNFWGRSEPIHHLPDDDLIDLLSEKGSYDPLMITMMRNEGSSFLRTLKADLKLCSEYRYKSCRPYQGKTIVTFAMDDDLCDYGLIPAWTDYCEEIDWILYETGGHFFIKERADELIRTILETYHSLTSSVT